MSVGIGLDVVYVPEFQARLEDPYFITATFTEGERAYCDSRPGAVRRAHGYGGRYAAKEALVKAIDMAAAVLGAQGPDGNLAQAEVVATTTGPPRLVPRDTVAEWLRSHRIRSPLLTITHDGPVAAAFVLLARTL